jgi:O-antigen/teichoic acid export membrane protein
MAGYGVPSFFANSATLALNQGPTALIGHFHPEAFVAYYSLPLRLLQYSVDAIMRIGFVTAPNTAEMIASGRREYVAKLGMYLNRYCLTLFLPFSAFLWIYGGEMITVWVGEALAAQSAPLLPAFILGATLAQAAQFNSSSILFGMARHGSYAISLVLEAAVMIAGVSLLTPRYGIVAVAWVSSALMILNRGFVTPWVVCRNLEFPFSRYMTSIYVRPALSLVPAVCLSLWIKSRWLPGRNWPELIAALGLIAVTHYASAYFSCVEPEHRVLLRQWVLQRLPLPGRRA